VPAILGGGGAARSVADLTRLHAHEMAALLRSGEVSSRQLTEAHLAVAERQNRALNAWLVIYRADALAQADAADKRIAEARRDAGAAALAALHPLCGVPVGLKDLVSVKGGQATAGSKILKGYIAPFDSTVTAPARGRRRDPGQDEHGRVRHGLVHGALRVRPHGQPWDLTRVPGGSSGGSARPWPPSIRPAGIGTDTGGSIRQPASLCGIVGLKPTYGRVSRYGIVAFASSLDQIGPFARDARDAALLLHAVSGRDERDATSRAGTRPAELLALAGERRRSRRVPRRASASRCRGVLRRRHGARRRRPRPRSRRRHGAGRRDVEEVSLPHTDYGLATYYIIAPAECSSNLARFDGVKYGHNDRSSGEFIADYLRTRGSGFGPEVKRRIMLGTYALSAGYYDAYYLKAQKVRTLIKSDFDAVWAAGFDAICAPTSPTVAFPLGAKMDDPVAMYLSDACTLPVNMAGLPGMSIPAGLSDGLPVGLQIIGAPWSELSMLRLARGYEGITARATWRDLDPAELQR
jgi:aspartyl-tRNA(Asn)/glutamyl-tRNA(Gln) amidotransferase subunit A